ncbi:MAG: hypothetical protein KC546_01670 [Anaerolineae bacterium]|nr:hypothetical protein [Anaerolineae bacterium]MCA9891642.1 hypothetical protein [Anaerolineae bacterium]
MSKRWQKILNENLAWFLGALVLAFFVWYVATLQADPFVTQSFSSIPIRLDVSDGLIVTNSPPEVASITITGQQSIMGRLRREDIVIHADLMAASPGVQTVQLVAEVNRVVSIDDTRPTQITVELESIESGQKPVIIETTDPPADITAEQPVVTPLDVNVSGASSDVGRVVGVYGEVDLSESRSALETQVTLVPRDENGRRVDNVTLDPTTARVSINLYRRDDVVRLAVRPNLQLETTEEGYTLTTIRSDPTEVFVRGSSTALADLGDTVFTAPISLTGRTSDFQVDVPLELPADVVVLPANDRNVSVEIGIEAQMSVVQFDSVPVDFIGLGDGLSLDSTASTISVVINAPRILLDSLTSDDVHAVVDVSGFGVGEYEITPQINLARGQAQAESIISLPNVLNVVVVSADEVLPPTPEPTSTGN